MVGRIFKFFNWGKDQKSCFEASQNHLMLALILRFPNFNSKIYIKADDSTINLGTMLNQSCRDVNLSYRLIVLYAIRLLGEDKCKSGISDLEGLAMSWAIAHFKTYIHGMQFTIIIKHSAKKALEDKSLLTGCLLKS